jgi:hypothetical protein
MSDPYADRREFPRVPLALRVQLEGEPESHELTSRDLSAGGLFLFARDPRPLNQRIALTFEAGARQVRAEGVVVHHMPGAGYGVRFEGLTEVDRGFLVDFVASLRSRAQAA